MKKLTILLIMMMLIGTGSFSQVIKHENPFFMEYSTPFKMPPFDQIDTSDYLPAYVKGIAEREAEIAAIINNTEAPTFENTIVPYDRSNKLLSKVGSVFGTLSGANTTPALQALARKITPMTTRHRDNIMLNEKLFQRIKQVYDTRDKVNLTADQKRVVEKYYEDFVRNGANLTDAEKEKLRGINQQLSKLGLQFNENLLAETNTNFILVVDKLEDLAGLPQDVIDAAAITAKDFKQDGKWVFTLQKPSMLPFLQYAKNRSLREKLYRGYFERCNNNDKFDNKENLLKIAKLRAERAQLLGYKTFAEYGISINMAKTPQNVYDFLNKVFVPAQAAAIKDREEMQKIIEKEGGNFKLEPWDWWYYAEKLKKEKFNLDEAELKPYFALGNVRDGMFYVANRLFGITFTKLANVPVYHSEVEVFEVKDEKNSHIGLLTLDYHPRPGKRVGAWCGRLRDQYYEDGKKVYPIVTITTNFTRPTGDLPALLTWDEVNTLFHEFGHALHGLFTDGQYERIAGRLPRDMGELPSQVMENWAGEPEVLKVYAKHYKTGKVIPQDLLARLQKSLTFNQGFETVEYIAASILDLDWHSISGSENIDVLSFEKASMEKLNLIKEILPRYRTTYFSHIVGGYSAGYYVYLWAAVLDTDAFNAFAETGDIYNKEVASKFRKYVLTEGGTDEGMVQYLKFRGKEPSIDPLLKKRGLK